MEEVTRYIKPSVERELWGRAGGRCEFKGHNKILYRSSVTQESVNIAEKAHIYSFSEKGPRGWGPFKTNKKALNNIGNLLLICHECHCKIDDEKDGGRYAAQLLSQWKDEHEKRIEMVTGVNPKNKSNVILYGANIGDETSVIQPDYANWALFPKWYPVNEKPTTLDMTWEGKDDRDDYWLTEKRNLVQNFERKVNPLIQEKYHFSIFGLAPIPLLIKLGTLFTDKIPAQVYQLHREPEQSWQWSSEKTDTDYKIIEPASYDKQPVLIISLSGKIDHSRIYGVVGKDVSIWELTIDDPNYDFLKCTDQLSQFRDTVRRLFVRISEKHGIDSQLKIFPAMPVSTAIEFGRVRMPKADMPWIIYDQNNKRGGFVEALRIERS